MRNTCLSAVSSTIKHTWARLQVNPGLRGDRPATNVMIVTEIRFDVCIKQMSLGEE